MKKIISIMMIICLVVSLAGCAELVSTEYENIEVNVVDTHHRGAWVQPIRVGKVTTYITHPAKYEVTVEYNGKNYTVDDKYAYNKYKDKTGQNIVGVLEIRTYDDGTVEYDITELGASVRDN
jgi:hypothetical protein